MSFLWLWSGIVFFIVFYGPAEVALFDLTVTGLWYIVGVLFIVEGILILVLGVARSSLSFKIGRDQYSIAGAVMIVYGTIIYPVVGLLTGFTYLTYPIFGIAPCPVTIFTLGLLQWTDQKVSVSVTIIPFIWAVMGVLPVIVLGIWADVGLILSGIIGFPLILLRKRKANI